MSTMRGRHPPIARGWASRAIARSPLSSSRSGTDLCRSHRGSSHPRGRRVDGHFHGALPRCRCPCRPPARRHAPRRRFRLGHCCRTRCRRRGRPSVRRLDPRRHLRILSTHWIPICPSRKLRLCDRRPIGISRPGPRRDLRSWRRTCWPPPTRWHLAGPLRSTSRGEPAPAQQGEISSMTSRTH
jgi:hypothetical protein